MPEILARQAERDEFLSCPVDYSAERDLKRRDELLEKRPRRSMAEETELAFGIARITTSEAAFNRSPEGQIRRRIADLQYRRDAANRERNRDVGLTRVQGEELDELSKRYPPKAPLGAKEPLLPHVPILQLIESKRRQAAAGTAPDPDFEMEELAPTFLERHEQERAQEAELIERRRAAGDPDPWDGKAPTPKSMSWKGGVFSTRSSLPPKRPNCNRSPGCIRKKSRE